MIIVLALLVAVLAATLFVRKQLALECSIRLRPRVLFGLVIFQRNSTHTILLLQISGVPISLVALSD
jgi:hypothetical protein